MKTKFLPLLLLLLPFSLSAQWSAVRFDQVSTFHKVFSASSNTAFAIGYGCCSLDDFLARTNDGGLTWDSIAISSQTDHYQLGELYFRSVNEGYAGGTNNNLQTLIRTVDNGTTWTEITPDPSSSVAIAAVYFTDAMHGFAGAGTKFYTTTNGGISWTSQNLSISIADMAFSDAQHGFVSGSNATSNSTAQLLTTTDGGVTWNLSLSVVHPNLFFGNFPRIEMVHADTVFTYMGNTGRLFRTENTGLTWDTLVCDSAAYIQDIDFTNSQTCHVLSSMGQIYVSPDAANSWDLEYATAWGFYGPSIYLYSISFAGEIGYSCGTSGLIKRHEGVEGISEPSNLQAAASFFPNPYCGNQSLHIQLTAVKEGTAIVKIFDATGQVVNELSSVAISANGEMVLNELHLASGLYHVSVTTKQQTASGTLVITQ